MAEVNVRAANRWDAGFGTLGTGSDEIIPFVTYETATRIARERTAAGFAAGVIPCADTTPGAPIPMIHFWAVTKW